MAINFYAGLNSIAHLQGSGLGFYGSTFGSSVNLASWQDTTFITDANGTVAGAQANNIKWTHGSSGMVNTVSGLDLNKIPNYLATLNVRFTNGSAVKTQNAKLQCYDRTTLGTMTSGVTCRAVELIHPSILHTVPGSGGTTWTTMSGGVILSGCYSPGVSGLKARLDTTSNVTDTTHDYYFALSASPTTVGSKLFAAYFEVEYY